MQKKYSTFILGSGSSRRSEILSYFNLNFTIEVSHFDEASIKFNGDPTSYTQEIAINKALVLSEIFQDQLILTADTTVFKNKKIFNKPISIEESIEMISELNNSEHSVVSSVCAVVNKNIIVNSCESKVFFNDLNKDQIKKYANSCFNLKTAGGYAIQNNGSIAINKIDGCFYNVMGLPITATRKTLLIYGIDLWEHLQS